MSAAVLWFALLSSPTFVCVLLAIIVFAVIAIIANRNRSMSNDNTLDMPDSSLYPDRNRIIGSGSTIRYGGDTKYVNGVPVSTTDQLTEWYVLKGFADAISGHLCELMQLAEKGDCENYTELQEDWNTYYTRLRDLCIRHKMWNVAIGDNRIFIPTPSQLRAEKELHARFLVACELGIDNAYIRNGIRKKILDYLLAQPYHVAVRRRMVRELAGDDDEQRKKYRMECNNMVLEGILSETRDERGRLLIKKKRKAASKGKSAADDCLEPSVFHYEIYKSIDYRMWCKVKHTVGQPENVDMSNNRCEFHSLSRGELYHTSLTQCTCKAYKNGSSPCKHMVALARHLRYI